MGEVTGLLIADLSLDGDIPHFTITSHPHRRIKAGSSVRRVPLLGEALEAAKEALKAAGKSAFLFPAYGKVRGADAASQALMKHIRTVTDDAKLGNHSLRHTMEDRMALAGVNKYDAALVVGHALPGMSARYGGTDARLQVAQRALKAALGGKSKETGRKSPRKPW